MLRGGSDGSNSLTSLFSMENSAAVSYPFSIGHGDKVTADILNKCKESSDNMRYDKYLFRTGIRLGFSHMVKFQKGGCLESGSMIRMDSWLVT